MKLSVITLTYNSIASIEDHLKSLVKTLPNNSEVIVVDNNSTDGTQDILKRFELKKEIKNLQLILRSTNDGFSVGCNAGAAKARGEYLLFLNPDTKVLDDSLNKLVSYADSLDKFGIIGPRLMKQSGEIQASVRDLPTIGRAYKEYFLGEKSVFEEYIPAASEPTVVEAVYGAAMFIKKDVFFKVKGFDERYFLYYEDLSLCKKVRELGLDIIYYPKALIQHNVGSSVKTLAVSKLPFGIRTLAYFIPIKQSGGIYYQVKSGNIYHGVIKATIIRLIAFISSKMT